MPRSFTDKVQNELRAGLEWSHADTFAAVKITVPGFSRIENGTEKHFRALLLTLPLSMNLRIAFNFGGLPMTKILFATIALFSFTYSAHASSWGENFGEIGRPSGTQGWTFGIGPSLPAVDGTISWGPSDEVSRVGGGEKVALTFRTPKTLSSLKLTAFSKSGKGSVLIRAVTASLKAKPKSISTKLTGLSDFAQAQAGTNYKGLVMLANGDAVAIAPNQAFSKITFTLEGFKKDDASLLVEFNSADKILDSDWNIERDRPTPPDSGNNNDGRGCFLTPCYPDETDPGNALCNFPVPRDRQCNPSGLGF
ncbi:MAG: hypothetical protein ACXWQO_11130 [Bdellovibrionota bacterium]